MKKKMDEYKILGHFPVVGDNEIFFFFFARQKLEWLLPISSIGSRPSFEVVTGRHQVHRAGATTRVAALTIASAHAHDLGNARTTWARAVGVATSFWCRDLDEVRTEGSLVVT